MSLTTDQIPHVASLASLRALVHWVQRDVVSRKELSQKPDCPATPVGKRLDAATGADVTHATLSTTVHGTVFANPQVGGTLVLSAESGNVLFGATGRTWAMTGTTAIGETSRATPLFVGDRVYVRSASGVACFR